MEQKVARTKTAEQALVSLMNLCAKSEKCSADARRLMRGWGVSVADAERVLQRLVAERFIDDSRYAEAFVREKINLSGWGVYKITATLRQKGISGEVISSALEQCSGMDMAERLGSILTRKLRTVKAKNSADLRAKLLRYALGQGYDFSTAKEVVESLVKSENEQCDDWDY